MNRIGLPWLAAFGLSLSAFAQGPLTPPGAPAPTMKSLDQIEARTPISSLPYTITQPGSYYVTTNLTGGASGGITITTGGVTLDLNGFELVGVASAFHGIYVPGSYTNIAIRNGTVRNWAGYGVDAGGANNSQFERLRVSNNIYGIAVGAGDTVSGCSVTGNAEVGMLTGVGCAVGGCTAGGNGYLGILAGDGSTVSGCTVDNNTGGGISVGKDSTVSGCTTRANTGSGVATGTGSTVSSCTSGSNGAQGISVSDGTTVIGCSASSNTNNGILATSGCIIKDCQTSSNTGDGINIGNGFGGTTIRGCTSRSNLGDGIEVYNSCLVVDNTCDGNGSGAGIHVTGLANRIENNQSSSNSKGIGVDGGGNLIIRNSCSSNTTNYSIAANNKVGVTLIPPNSGAVVGNTGGSGASTDPSANYSF